MAKITDVCVVRQLSSWKCGISKLPLFHVSKIALFKRNLGPTASLCVSLSNYSIAFIFGSKIQIVLTENFKPVNKFSKKKGPDKKISCEPFLWLCYVYRKLHFKVLGRACLEYAWRYNSSLRCCGLVDCMAKLCKIHQNSRIFLSNKISETLFDPKPQIFKKSTKIHHFCHF